MAMEEWTEFLSIVTWYFEGWKVTYYKGSVDSFCIKFRFGVWLVGGLVAPLSRKRQRTLESPHEGPKPPSHLPRRDWLLPSNICLGTTKGRNPEDQTDTPYSIMQSFKIERKKISLNNYSYKSWFLYFTKHLQTFSNLIPQIILWVKYYCHDFFYR